jgi:hypothetical protein
MTGRAARAWGLAALVLVLLLALWPAAAPGAEVAAAKEVTRTQTSASTQTEDISLAVVRETRLGGSADAVGEVYEGLEDNVVVESGTESLARVTDGFAGAKGIVGINQSPGNNNNQGNLVSFGYIEAGMAAALLSGGAAEVINRDNVVEATGVTRASLIEGGAFRDFSGLLQVNQSAGNLNNQNNILCIAAGSEGVVALSEAALGQQVARNSVEEVDVRKRDVIEGSLSGVAGIVSINQSSGCGNNQTHMVVMSLQQLFF